MCPPWKERTKREGAKKVIAGQNCIKQKTYYKIFSKTICEKYENIYNFPMHWNFSLALPGVESGPVMPPYAAGMV